MPSPRSQSSRLSVRCGYSYHQVNVRVPPNSGERTSGLWQPQARSPLTLIIEAVDAVDAGTLMVPTEQEEVFGVLDLIGQQQADGLQRLLAPVYVVPQEEVVALWREATILKQPQKIIVLTMDVTCDPEKQVSTSCGVDMNPGPGSGSTEEGSRDWGRGAMTPSGSKRAWAGISPQILRGASSSKRMGWLRKISRDLRHRPRISFSVNCTFLPGREPCTGGGMGRQDPGSSDRRRVGGTGAPWALLAAPGPPGPLLAPGSCCC